VAKEKGAGLGFTDTKYFGQGCDDVSPLEVEIGWMLTPAFWGRG
jgi:RimJ/RimL family protein N-acetyltransferase